MATINDIVLIHLEDTPIFFARVESILPDHKKDWYQIKLLMLQIPLQVVTWILKDAYINGDEFFMNGKRMRLETVECPPEEPPVLQDKAPEPPAGEKKPPAQDAAPKKPKDSGGKIISFTDLKNSRPPKKSGTESEPPEPDIG